MVICDNASTDGTGELCRRMAAADPRIHYCRNPENIGGRRNHLRVFELSRGPYFKWMGHDDLLKPRFLESCMEALEHDPGSVLAFSNLEVIDENGAVLEKRNTPPAFHDSKAHLRLRSYWQASQYYQVAAFHGIIRREALARTSLLASWYGSDRWVVVELALMGRFAPVEDMLFQYREHRRRSVFQANPQIYWAPQTGSYLGVFQRFKHAARLLKTRELSIDERLAVLCEYAWYAVRSSYYWVPLLARELVAATRHWIFRTGIRK